jgi:glycogen debranching enzyme
MEPRSPQTVPHDYEVLSHYEWLLTNGIGGYAMGTVAGVNTRRYHGLLVAAVKPPAERVVLLAGVEAFVIQDGEEIGLSCNAYPGVIYPDGFRRIESFDYEDWRMEKDYYSKGGWLAYQPADKQPGSAKWIFNAGSAVIEKALRLTPGANECTISFKNLGRAPVKLLLKPLVCHKPHHENFKADPAYLQEIVRADIVTSIGHELGTLMLEHPDATVKPSQEWFYRQEHALEIDRGLDPHDDLLCPVELTYELAPGESALLRASLVDEVPVGEFGDPPFVVSGVGGLTILAGYPWFSDWGRDTMIAIPGLVLFSGHPEQARAILSHYANARQDGLLPNRFLDDGSGAEYNTVDASLWFCHAVHQTLLVDWNEEFASAMLGAMQDILKHYKEGMRFGIKMDPEDKLITQGEAGVQLTWMDAKIGDRVITPRLGKPVEINGLWINALGVVAWLRTKLQFDSGEWMELAEAADKSFNEKFWLEENGWFKDTVEPDDASLRPNQLIPLALPFGPRHPESGKALDAIDEHLLTPYGLRTLAPFEKNYHGRYEGPLAKLDEAYHQGTVWPWLLGPYCDAVLNVTKDYKRASRAVSKVAHMTRHRGLGGISEVYDGDAPHRANGCPWQAWSMGEVLRACMLVTNRPPLEHTAKRTA